MYDDYYEDDFEFAGTYVHDVEGWSDDDIYDVLDGEPNTGYSGPGEKAVEKMPVEKNRDANDLSLS